MCDKVSRMSRKLPEQCKVEWRTSKANDDLHTNTTRFCEANTDEYRLCVLMDLLWSFAKRTAEDTVDLFMSLDRDFIC